MFLTWYFLGLGAGANILCRLAIHSPDKVLGVVAIQPTASAATVLKVFVFLLIFNVGLGRPHTRPSRTSKYSVMVDVVDASVQVNL